MPYPAYGVTKQSKAKSLFMEIEMKNVALAMLAVCCLVAPLVAQDFGGISEPVNSVSGDLEMTVLDLSKAVQINTANIENHEGRITRIEEELASAAVVIEALRTKGQGPALRSSLGSSITIPEPAPITTAPIPRRISNTTTPITTPIVSSWGVPNVSTPITYSSPPVARSVPIVASQASLPIVAYTTETAPVPAPVQMVSAPTPQALSLIHI